MTDSDTPPSDTPDNPDPVRRVSEIKKITADELQPKVSNPQAEIEEAPHADTEPMEPTEPTPELAATIEQKKAPIPEPELAATIQQQKAPALEVPQGTEDEEPASEIAPTIEQKAAKPDKATPEPQSTAQVVAAKQPSEEMPVSESSIPNNNNETVSPSSTLPFDLDKTGAPRWLIFGAVGLIFLCAACICVSAIAIVILNA